MVKAEVDKGGVRSVAYHFVRHNAANETTLCPLAEEQAELADIRARSDEYGTTLAPNGDWVGVTLK